MEETQQLVNLKLIRNTCKRIENSLNKRFEKDADLYISIKDIEEIKKDLCKCKYGKIKGYYVSKKFSAEILTKVILKNAWLISNITYKDFKENFEIIFSECNNEMLNLIMPDIIENKIDIPEKFRNELIRIYANKLSGKESKKELDNGSNVIKVGNTIDVLFINTINSMKGSNTKYKWIQKYIDMYPKLINSSNILSKVINEDDMKNLLEDIFEDCILNSENSEEDRIWQDLFKKKNPKLSFNRIIQYIYLEGNTEACWLLKKYSVRIMEYDKENVEFYINSIMDLYNKSNNDIKARIIRVVSYINSQNKDLINKFSLAIERSLDENNYGLNKLYEKVKEEVAIDEDENIKDLYDEFVELDIEDVNGYKRLAFLLNKINDDGKEQLMIQFLNDLHGVNDDYIEQSAIELLKIIIETYFKNTRYFEILLESVDLFNYQKDYLIKVLLSIVESKDMINRGNYVFKNKIKNFIRDNDFELYQNLYTRT